MTDSDSQPTTIEELEWAVWPSFALLAGIRLDLFTPLKDGPMSLEQLADQLGVEADKLKPLLYALAASGLLKIDNGLFANSSEANRFLVRGLASYRGGKHEVLLNNWQAGLRTAESIRTGAPQAKLDFAGASAAELETFYRSNHAQALRRGRELAATFDLSSHRSLLDVGGGSGGLAIAVTETHPRMQATVAELPTVTPITRRIVEEAGASGRVQVQSINILNESPSGAFDAAVLSSVKSQASMESSMSFDLTQRSTRASCCVDIASRPPKSEIRSVRHFDSVFPSVDICHLFLGYLALLRLFSSCNSHAFGSWSCLEDHF